jgi:hypothetical protein
MALLLPWLNLGVCVFLGVALALLALDGKGQWKALGAALEALAALQRQATAHDDAIGALTRAVAALAPSPPPAARPLAHCNQRPDCQYTARDIERTPAGIDPRDWRSLGACACPCEGCGGGETDETERETLPPSSGRRPTSR